MALVLGAVGIYGVVSHLVSERTREIGIRIAIGAEPRTVTSTVVREGMETVLMGIAMGLAGAYALTRVMATLLFEVSPTDPITYGSAAGVLVITALAAMYGPARRAADTDPMMALRACLNPIS